MIIELVWKGNVDDFKNANLDANTKSYNIQFFGEKMEKMIIFQLKPTKDEMEAVEKYLEAQAKSEAKKQQKAEAK